MGLYQESPNYNPAVKFGPTAGFTSFTWTYIGKTLEISLYLAIKPRGYQILHVALSSGPSPRGVNYSPRVEFITKAHKFYMGLYSEIFRNPLGPLVSENDAKKGIKYILIISTCNSLSLCSNERKSIAHGYQYFSFANVNFQ